MNTEATQAGAGTHAPHPATLIDVVRDPQLAPLLLALCDFTVSRLRIPGAQYFTYSLEGDETLASPEDMAAISRAVANTLGLDDVDLNPQVLPHLQAQETIVFTEPIRNGIMRELAELIIKRDEQTGARVDELVETLGVLFAKIKQIAGEQPERRLISPAAVQRIEQMLTPGPRPLIEVLGEGKAAVDRSKPYMLDRVERDAVLAGLRLLQLEVDNPDDTGWFGEDLKRVYTDEGRHQGLSATDIDVLCDRLNF